MDTNSPSSNNFQSFHQSGKNFDNKTFNELFEKETGGGTFATKGIHEISESSGMHFASCLSSPLQNRVILGTDGTDDKLAGVPDEGEFLMSDTPVKSVTYSGIQVKKIFDDHQRFDINEFNSKFEEHRGTNSISDFSPAPMSMFGGGMEGMVYSPSGSYKDDIRIAPEETTPSTKNPRSAIKDREFLAKLLKKSTKR